MTLRYSDLARAHNAKAVEELGESSNDAVQNRKNRKQQGHNPALWL